MVGAIQQNRQTEDTNDGTIEDPNFDRQNNRLNPLQPIPGSFDDDYQPTNEAKIYYDESFSYLTRRNLSHLSADSGQARYFDPYGSSSGRKRHFGRAMSGKWRVNEHLLHEW